MNRFDRFDRDLRGILATLASEERLRDVAARAKLAQSTVSRLLRGVTKRPQFRTVWLTCCALGLSVEVDGRGEARLSLRRGA